MNRNYFAKWIIQDRNIQIGDHVKYKDPNYNYQIEFIHKIVSSTADGHTGPADDDILVSETTKELLYKDCQPVKMYLCSLDIKIGDMIHANDNSGVMLITKETRVGVRGELSMLTGEKSEGDITWAQLESDWYKILGEISPEATWVKEYDEFTEDELRKIVYDGTEHHLLLNSGPPAKRIEILGPCGYFH